MTIAEAAKLNTSNTSVPGTGSKSASLGRFNMTPKNFTWSDRFPLDSSVIDAEDPEKGGIYSTYVVGPPEIVGAAGYIPGSEELVYIGAAWGKSGLKSRLKDRAGSVKNVLPIEDDPNSSLCLEEKWLIRLGLGLEFAYISGANSRKEATRWEELKTDEYKESHGGRRPPGNKINPPRSR